MTATPHRLTGVVLLWSLLVALASAGGPVRAARVQSGQAYACPMHPHVRSDRQGICPTCGMTLIDMTTAVRGTYSIDLAWTPRAVRAGQPATLRLFVERPRTNVIVREFEVVHERLFHLFVVSWDLVHFRHLHPVPQADGAMAVTMTLPRAGAYQLYADFLPTGGTPQLVQKAVFTAGATPLAGARAIDRPPIFTSEVREGSDHGLRMRLEPGRLVAGRLEVLGCVLEDARTGLPIADLDPYLGAWGHALIVSSDLADAVHSHPVTPLTSPGGPRIFFSQRFPRPGFYRMWIQVQRRGEVATIPFTLEVEQDN